VTVNEDELEERAKMGGCGGRRDANFQKRNQIVTTETINPLRFAATLPEHRLLALSETLYREVTEASQDPRELNSKTVMLISFHPSRICCDTVAEMAPTREHRYAS
jgi:hypothetical protein